MGKYIHVNNGILLYITLYSIYYLLYLLDIIIIVDNEHNRYYYVIILTILIFNIKYKNE